MEAGKGWQVARGGSGEKEECVMVATEGRRIWGKGGIFGEDFSKF